MVLVHDDNILHPNVIRYVSDLISTSKKTTDNKKAFIFQMYNVHKKVEKIKTQEGKGWQNYCFRIPVVEPPKILQKRRKRNSDDLFSDFEDWGASDFESE